VDPRERNKIYNGASDGFSRAVEMVATPLIFGFLGHRLDAWVGTTPLFTVLFAVFCLGYVVWRTCAGYQADMVRHEAEFRANRSQRRRSSGSRSGSSSPVVAHE